MILLAGQYLDASLCATKVGSFGAVYGGGGGLFQGARVGRMGGDRVILG